ncbi:hypothetical protein FB451DRAFT_1409933 [Mycena latifolia]|nr:hypothetical protein FB451DRAFT_1409933 [Mycena latifolia]
MADVLKATDCFKKELGDYDLREPQFLFMLNTNAAWRPTTSAVVTPGAKKVTTAIAALTCRIEATEREARACDADTKARLTQIDSNIASIATVAANLSRRQEEMGRGLLLLQRETQLTTALGRIDSALLMARNAYTHPLDDQEKQIAHDEIRHLRKEKEETEVRLASLQGTNLLSIGSGPPIPLPPQPTISPPPIPLLSTPSTPPGIVHPATAAAVTTTTTDSPPKPPKRPRKSLEEGECSDEEVAEELNLVDEDMQMVRTLPAHSRNCLMAARCDSKDESKTNSRVGPNLPTDDYIIFEEPGVQTDNHHLFKWGTILGI